MGKRAEVGTPKYLANAMKSKGLQRLRWYCQVCEKQCRDENGFKCHTQSEGHLRQMLVVGENAGRHISDYSSQFQYDFVKLLQHSCGTQRVKANNIYQEYIRDKNHMHMNATRWVTLTSFCHSLARAGIVKIEDTEKGLFITWIDNSPKALAKAQASEKKEKLTKSDEQLERSIIRKQIRRAAEDEDSSSDSGDAPSAPQELERPEGEPVKIAFSFSKPATSTSASTSTPSTSFSMKVNTPTASTSAAPVAPKNVFKMANPLKPAAPKPAGNAFKMAAAQPPVVAGVKRDREPLSVAESLMMEDMARKRRRTEQESVRPVA